MYGLVNKAIYDLVVNNYGEETWEKIKAEAEVEVGMFMNLQQYDDSVTYKLVGAASKILGADAYDILVGFGKFWITYTAKEGYGEMLDSAGETFPEFLSNLDNMHLRVGYTYDNLMPPSFHCEVIDDQNLRLEYHTHREHLAPLVVGLLQGLGEKFHLEVKVDHIKTREEIGYDLFHINHTPIVSA